MNKVFSVRVGSSFHHSKDQQHVRFCIGTRIWPCFLQICLLNPENSGSTQKILGQLRKFGCQKIQARNFWLADSCAFNLLFIKFFQSQNFFWLCTQKILGSTRKFWLHQNVLAVPFLAKHSDPKFISGMLQGLVSDPESTSHRKSCFDILL